ncbi:MAG: hypothetical protein LUP95_01730 [Euryarchaeota archaeon]|nr:hypothetical protein [Euryarchaeota archaeon]
MTPTTIAGSHSPNNENSNAGCGGRLAPLLVCPVSAAIYCTVAFVVSVVMVARGAVLSDVPCDESEVLFESGEVDCPSLLFEEEESSGAAVITIVVTTIASSVRVSDALFTEGCVDGRIGSRSGVLSCCLTALEVCVDGFVGCMVNAAPELDESDRDSDVFDCCSDVLVETGTGLEFAPVDTAGCVLFDFSLSEAEEGFGEGVGDVLGTEVVGDFGLSLGFAGGCVDDLAVGDGVGIDVPASSLSIVAFNV